MRSIFVEPYKQFMLWSVITFFEIWKLQLLFMTFSSLVSCLMVKFSARVAHQYWFVRWTFFKHFRDVSFLTKSKSKCCEGSKNCGLSNKECLSNSLKRDCDIWKSQQAGNWGLLRQWQSPYNWLDTSFKWNSVIPQTKEKAEYASNNSVF